MTSTQVYKVIINGEPYVGKTTLRRTFMGVPLQAEYIKTLGVDFSLYRGETVSYQIWDISGELDKHSFRGYFEGTSAVILVFDLTNSKSLDMCQEWINRVSSIVETPIPYVLVGNKSDLRTADKGPKDQEIQQKLEVFQQSNGVKSIKFYETSALTGTNVSETFDWIFEQIEGDGV